MALTFAEAERLARRFMGSADGALVMERIRARHSDSELGIRGQSGFIRDFMDEAVEIWKEQVERKVRDAVVSTPELEPSPALVQCPVCKTDLETSSATLCSGCGTPSHPQCREYVGRCAIYGCRA